MSLNSGCYIKCDGPDCEASSDDYPELRGTRHYDAGRLALKLMKEHSWSVIRYYHRREEQHFCPRCKSGGTGSVIGGLP